MSDVILVALIGLIAELAKSAHASGEPVTWDMVDAAIARRKAAVAENAALDPEEE